MVAFSHNQLLDFHVYLILLGWFVRRRREEWWKIPVWERKWRRKDSQGKVGISAHFSGGRCCHARGFNPKPYYSPCAKDLWVKGGLQRPQESKNHGNPFCLSVTNMEAIFAVTNSSSVEIEPAKIQACTGFEPMTSAIPCSALPTELTSHYIGSK